jgi:hypothetical protein
MKNRKAQFLSAMVLVLGLLSCLGAYAQVTPSADAYTNSADPTTNYGATTLLAVDGASQITYIQFNLASIPSGASVSQATLKLYVNAVTRAGSFNVDYANGTWAENTITHNLAPALGTTIVSSVPVTAADKNQYILVNITPAVQDWLKGTTPNDGIALVANGSFNATFDSKENTTTSHPAELDIVFAGGSGGDGTITGVTTASGSGLSGGGTSGTLNLSLTTSCATNQVLQWNGAAWACANSTGGGGTITGVTAGTDLTGGGTSGNVTLNLNTGALNSTYAQLSAANTFSANQTMNGNLSVAGNVSAGHIGAEISTGSAAILGYDSSSGGAVGVAGLSNNGQGVSGTSNTSYGVYGLSSGSWGVYGQSLVSDGVYGVGPNVGVYGSGSSSSGFGVYGNGLTGVAGISNGNYVGVYGSSSGSGSYGVFGSDSSGTGVYGSGSYGVYGTGTIGVYGVSTGGSNPGVYAQATGGWAVDAYNTSSGTGVLAGSSSGWAAWFNGNVEVDGNLSKAGGSFKIDHPLDPANKYLYHSFVESPDMMNIYNGNVTTDAQGDATVTLPEWFETLNRDFRYQLTVIGQFAQAMVSTEIADGRFSIKTDKPSVKVSWQVTGIRQDAWANAHRIPVEEEKPGVERGTYLHPELFGAPEEKGVLWATAPKAMKQWKEARSKAAPQSTDNLNPEGTPELLGGTAGKSIALAQPVMLQHPQKQPATELNPATK